MMGIPPEDEAQIFDWTNVILGVGDPEYVGSFEQLMGVADVDVHVRASSSARTAAPTPATTSPRCMMHAEVDGERLTAQEFGSFFILLVVAGNETTRNAISHGMKLLTDHPDQRDAVVRQLRRPPEDRRRRDRPLRDAGDPLPTHRHRGHGDQQHQDRGRPEGGAVVQLGQPRRDGVRRTADGFDITRPAATAAGRLRCRWAALLPRREPGPPRDRRDLRRDPHARYRSCRSPREPDYLQSNFINGIKRMRCTW